MSTGERRGEVLASRWSAVDLDAERPTFRVEGTLQRVGGVLTVLPPKTSRSRRVIPLSASVVAMLRRVKAEQAERRLICGPAWHDTGFIFDRGDGQPVDPDDFTRAFRTARKAAGLDGVRLHDVRHAFATMLVDAGTNARVVSDLLGHATVAFTLQTCYSPDEKMAGAAIDAVEALLGPALGG